MLHEGGPGDSAWYCQNSCLTRLVCKLYRLQFVQIGFLKNLVLHLEPSPSIHSYGYGFDSGNPASRIPLCNMQVSHSCRGLVATLIKKADTCIPC